MSVLKILFVSSGFLFFVASSPVKAKVTINEIFPGTNSDWIEIYNTSDATTSASLVGYRIRDTTSRNKKDLSGELNPGEYIVVEFNNWLNKEEDSVRLIKINGSNEEEIEVVSYGPSGNICTPSESESVGRFPDGGANMVRFSAITKGQANTNSLHECSISTPEPSVSPELFSSPTPTVFTDIAASPSISSSVNPSSKLKDDEPTTKPRVF